MVDQHERDINDMAAKFKKIDDGYRSDSIESQKQVHMMELEREDNERLVQLYRT